MGVWVAEDAAAFLTVPEIARRLGVSETTVHNWRKAYGEMVPSTVGVDGYRRYALRRFEEIAALRERKLPAPAIRAALTGHPATPDEPSPNFEAQALAILDRIAIAVERIADHLEGRQGEERG